MNRVGSRNTNKDSVDLLKLEGVTVESLVPGEGAATIFNYCEMPETKATKGHAVPRVQMAAAARLSTCPFNHR